MTALYRLVELTSGSVAIDGVDISKGRCLSEPGAAKIITYTVLKLVYLI